MAFYNVQFCKPVNRGGGFLDVYEEDCIEDCIEEVRYSLDPIAGEYAYVYPEGMDFAEAYDRDLLYMVRG